MRPKMPAVCTKPAVAPGSSNPLKPWSNDASARGTRVVVHVNNVKTAELPDDTQGRKSGHLALQLHGGQDMEIRFRKIEILSEPFDPSK